MHQEGLFFPCTKIYRRGELQEDIVNIIRFNSRYPERTIGDMRAQISACRTGERRVAEIIERFGVDVFEAACDEIQDHGERLARAGLARLPKGTWSAYDFLDDDGVDEGPPGAHGGHRHHRRRRDGGRLVGQSMGSSRAPSTCPTA